MVAGIRNLDEQWPKTMADQVVAQGFPMSWDYLPHAWYHVLSLTKVVSSRMKQGRWDVALNRLVGIAGVKEQVGAIRTCMAKFNQKQAEQGSIVEDTCLHSLFLGNPGTEKTTCMYTFWAISSSKRGWRNSLKFLGAIWLEKLQGQNSEDAWDFERNYTRESSFVLQFKWWFGKEAFRWGITQNLWRITAVSHHYLCWCKKMHDFLHSSLKSGSPTHFDLNYNPDEILR